jgi:hypothetical protein
LPEQSKDLLLDTPDPLNWQARRKLFAELLGADPEQYERGGVPFVGPVLDNTLAQNPAEASSTKRRLIELLELENRVVEQSKTDVIKHGDSRGLSEGYVNYYGDLIAAVTRLGDKQSVNALIGAIATGGMVRKALVALGADALEPVADLMQSGDPVIRSSSLIILTDMLEKVPEVSKDPDRRLIVKRTMLQAAVDPDPIVRRRSVEGLLSVGDLEALSMIERLALSDPYRADVPGMEGRYIVREAAQQALEKLRDTTDGNGSPPRR